MVQTMARRIRQAFFVDGQDISQLSLLLDLAKKHNIGTRALKRF